jgi:hypothetical protein
MRQMQLTIAITLFATCLPAAAPAPSPRALPKVQVAGTYTNLEYNDEGGDLVGIEVKIVPLGDRYQAAVLVSEGAPSPMMLVDVTVTAQEVRFRVPRSGQEPDDSWSFRGTVTARALNGVITHASGVKEQVKLTRRCGYWDR